MVINDLPELLELIRMLPDTRHYNIIAISGFAGSGKTTLAHELQRSIENSVIVSGDDFLKSNYMKRSEDWECVDRDRLIEQVLVPAESGLPLRYQAFDWKTGKADVWKSVSGVKNIILEGLGIIHPGTSPYFDFSIWMDTSLQEAARRGIARDKQLLQIDHEKLWFDVWLPNDRDYFDKYHPIQYVDCEFRMPEPTNLNT